MQICICIKRHSTKSMNIYLRINFCCYLYIYAYVLMFHQQVCRCTSSKYTFLYVGTCLEYFIIQIIFTNIYVFPNVQYILVQLIYVYVQVMINLLMKTNFAIRRVQSYLHVCTQNFCMQIYVRIKNGCKKRYNEVV